MSHHIDVILNNVAEPLEEFVITLPELEKLVKSGEKIRSYCGYEPSGPIHIGYFPSIYKAKEIAEIGHVIILLADIHAYINHKGPLELIQDLSVNYWIPVFKALGVNAKFILGSEFQTSSAYIRDIYTLSRRVSTNRAVRAVTLILRKEKDIDVAAALYPIMQVLDIIHLELNLAFGGTDQRKIHALLREVLASGVVKELNVRIKPPVCIHLPMIVGLKAGEKMSSSKPDTHIAVHDFPQDIRAKMKRAYCPPKTVDPNINPIFSILRYIIMPYATEFVVIRPEKYGGDVKYSSFDEIARDYLDGRLHPLDIKNAVADWIIEVIRPVHELFGEDPDVLRPVYKLQRWNYERGYISKTAWKKLEDTYTRWFR